jgi:hypothetical protein
VSQILRCNTGHNASIDGDQCGHDNRESNEDGSQAYRYREAWITDFQLDAIRNLGRDKVEDIGNTHTDNQSNAYDDGK